MTANHVLSGLPPVVPTFTFANLPTASENTGMVAFCSNAAVTTGTGQMVYSDGTAWRRVDTGANAAAA